MQLIDATKAPWMPAVAKAVPGLRYAIRCLWCGAFIGPGTPAYVYPEERACGHAGCHEEASLGCPEVLR